MKYCGLLKIFKGFSLSELKNTTWKVGEMRKVVFFKGIVTPVYLTSVDDTHFTQHLKLIDDTTDPICLDLEWKISFSSDYKHHISLFQFATKTAVLIVRHLSSTPSQKLKDFLQRHDFIGKSTGNDRKKLSELFGNDFTINLEDIVTTRLCPHGFSRNFNDLVKSFVGVPLFAIKDKGITLSNWQRKDLAIAQVLYAAYDVVSLQLALPNLPLPNDPTFQKNRRKQTITRTKSTKVKPAMSAAESAEMLRNITFPLREPVPEDFKLDLSYERNPKAALREVLVLFGNDPDEIPCTYEIEYDDEPIKSEYLPDDIFQSSAISTQQNITQDKELDLQNEKPKEKMKYLSSSSDEDIPYNF